MMAADVQVDLCNVWGLVLESPLKRSFCWIAGQFAGWAAAAPARGGRGLLHPEHRAALVCQSPQLPLLRLLLVSGVLPHLGDPTGLRYEGLAVN